MSCLILKLNVYEFPGLYDTVWYIYIILAFTVPAGAHGAGAGGALENCACFGPSIPSRKEGSFKENILTRSKL